MTAPAAVSPIAASLRDSRVRRAIAWLGPIGLTALAYWLGAQAGLSLALVRDQVTPLWPPTGIAVAAMIWSRGRAWPGILLGALLVNVPLGPTLGAAALISAGNTAAPGLAFLALRRLRFDPRMGRFRDAVVLVAAGGMSAMVLSASVGTAVLALSGKTSGSTAPTTWWVWWTGDVMGVLVFAPLLFVLASPSLWRTQLRGKVPEFILLLLGGLALMASPFNLAPGHPLFVVFPLLVWAALRLQITGAAAVACLISVSATVLAVHGSPPFVDLTVLARMQRLQIFNGCVAITCYLLSALTTERLATRRSLEEASLELEATVERRTLELSDALEQARQSQALLATFFDSAPLGFTVVSLDGDAAGDLSRRRSVQVNPAFAAMLGYEPRELLRTDDPFGITHPDDRDADRRRLKALLDSGEPAAHWEKRYLHKDGRTVWARASVSVVRDRQLRPQFLVNFVEDITDRRAAEADLQHRADHDPLTGLKNRAVLEASLGDQIVRSRRTGDTSAVVMLDLDGLKAINDRFGHHVGDRAIIALADAIRGRIRSTDVAARLGGDEFVVLLRHVDQVTAHAVGEEIRNALRATPLITHGTMVELGVSIGYGEVSASTADVASVLRAADAAMYAAKPWRTVSDPAAQSGSPGIALPERSVREAEGVRQIELVIESAPNAMLIADGDGRIVLANGEAAVAFGYTRGELLDLRVDDLVPEASRGHHPELRAAYLANPQRRRMGAGRELHGLRKDGSEVAVEIGLNPILIGGELHVLASIIDITQRTVERESVEVSRQAALSQVERMLTHDPVTGLPNRAQLIELLDAKLAHAEADDANVAVVLLDIDHFRRINDTLGHDVGDQLIREAAARLCAWAQAGDLVACLGGDEFAVAFAVNHDEGDLPRQLDSLGGVLAAPLRVRDYEVPVTVSMGVATFPDDGEAAATLLRNADIAMYEAKDAGRAGVRRFDDLMRDELREKHELSGALRQALDNDELSVVYQPQYRLTDGRLSGFEALARWDSPGLGEVSPDRFVPLAEDTGLIARLGDWVARQACADIVQLENDLGIPLQLAVNVSPRQLRGADWLEPFMDAIRTTGVAPERFSLEITEGTVVEDEAEIAEAMARLRALGIKVVIDDFGLGYSNLAYLTRFPVDKIKIDRSFTSRIGANSGETAVVNAIIAMAHALGTTVVAEGVETAEQELYLRAQGCDQVQGFRYGRGLPVEEARALAVTLPGFAD